MIQNGISKTDHYSFGRSLQVILQIMSTITERGGRDVSKYASTVGLLVYTMVRTRPDLAYTISTVSRFMSN